MQMLVLNEFPGFAQRVELAPLISLPVENVCPPSSEKERNMGEEM